MAVAALALAALLLHARPIAAGLDSALAAPSRDITRCRKYACAEVEPYCSATDITTYATKYFPIECEKFATIAGVPKDVQCEPTICPNGTVTCLKIKLVGPGVTCDNGEFLEGLNDVTTTVRAVTEYCVNRNVLPDSCKGIGGAGKGLINPADLGIEGK